MIKQFFKTSIFIFLFSIPFVLLAQPGWSGPVSGSGLCDTCTAPIDQQTLLLASGGVVYAIHKLRQYKRK